MSERLLTARLQVRVLPGEPLIEAATAHVTTSYVGRGLRTGTVEYDLGRKA